MDTLVYNSINQSLDEEEKYFCSILLNYAILQNEEWHYISVDDLLSIMPGYNEDQIKNLLLRVASPISYGSIEKKNKRCGSLMIVSFIMITQGILYYSFSSRFKVLVNDFLYETKSSLPMFIASKNPFFELSQESIQLIPQFIS